MQDQVLEWVGHDVVDIGGDKVGKVEAIYLDDETQEPEWLAIKTGLFGSKVSFAPLRGASADGEVLRIPFEKAQVKDAPRVDPDGHLEPDEEEALFRHYAVEGRSQATISRGADADAGHDTSGPNTDDAMTRSEEELRVGTQQVERGRVRLRKYVVTEHVQTTVPVSREEVRVEREPITEANIDKAMDGPDISEEEHEVVLHEERPVVGTETVPKERVRISKDTVAGEEQVGGDVRKEQIDLERDPGA